MANVMFRMPGHRKATQSFCNACQEWHNTHRAADGSVLCPKSDCFTKTKEDPIEFPAVVGLIPRSADVSA